VARWLDRVALFNPIDDLSSNVSFSSPSMHVLHFRTVPLSSGAGDSEPYVLLVWPHQLVDTNVKCWCNGGR
jgi:hypothetical protein